MKKYEINGDDYYEVDVPVHKTFPLSEKTEFIVRNDLDSEGHRVYIHEKGSKIWLSVAKFQEAPSWSDIEAKLTDAFKKIGIDFSDKNQVLAHIAKRLEEEKRNFASKKFIDDFKEVSLDCDDIDVIKSYEARIPCPFCGKTCGETFDEAEMYREKYTCYHCGKAFYITYDMEE